LWRKTQNKGWYKNSKYIHLWVHLLFKANHKPKEFMWNNKIIIIKDGQLLTGRKSLERETGINEKTVDRILKLFENEQQIKQETTNKFRLITVINWKDYQGNEQQCEQQTGNRRATDGQQTSTNKNIKNDKNDKKILSEQGSQIKQVMEIFYQINPTLNWGNKTTRKATADLIKKFGLEGTKRMAEAVVAVQGKPYAPVATTPYQMKEKLAQFKIYFDKQKGERREVFNV